MKGMYPNNENSKLMGRVYADGSQLWLTQSGSGCEFIFKGRQLEIILSCDDDSIKEDHFRNMPRVCVKADGRTRIKKVVESKDERYALITSDEPVEAVISVSKLSEAAFSLCGVKVVTDDEAVMLPVSEKPKRIGFIGDSITCGYGVDDSNSHSEFSTEAENALKSYAVKCADILGAEYSLFAYSGYGVISGWTADGTRNTREVLPKHYEKLCHSYKTADGTDLDRIAWDFSSQTEDIVVINLGTNDQSFCRFHEEGYAEFEDAYAELLEIVHRCQPDAKLISCIGIIPVEMGESMHKAVERFVDISGAEVYEFRFTPQNGWLGYGSDWHPSAETHEYAAEELAEFIRVNRILE